MADYMRCGKWEVGSEKRDKTPVPLVTPCHTPCHMRCGKWEVGSEKRDKTPVPLVTPLVT
jgi:hypothetical protein